MMITIIDRVILYQHATLLVLFNDSQMNLACAQGQVGFFVTGACSASTSHWEGGPAADKAFGPWARPMVPVVVIKCPAEP